MGFEFIISFSIELSYDVELLLLLLLIKNCKIDFEASVLPLPDSPLIIID